MNPRRRRRNKLVWRRQRLMQKLELMRRLEHVFRTLYAGSPGSVLMSPDHALVLGIMVPPNIPKDCIVRVTRGRAEIVKVP